MDKEIWFVHDRRSDGLVARKWLMHRGAWLPTHELVRDSKLEKLRAKLPLGLTRRDPAPTDATSVIEVWG